METAPPSEPEVAALLVEHAARFPEKFKITVRGDHGAAVSLPLLVVNPEPDGVGWNDFSRACMKGDPPADLAEQLVADAIVWPDSKKWATWVQRWPSLPSKVAEAVLAKVGAMKAAFTDPPKNERPPGPLASILDAHPRAVWVKVNPPGGALYAFAVEAPAPAAWRIFKKNLTAAGPGLAKIMREIACSSVIGCVRVEGDSVTAEPHEPVLERWPGLVGHVVAEVSSLTGAGAEVAPGGW